MSARKKAKKSGRHRPDLRTTISAESMKLIEARAKKAHEGALSAAVDDIAGAAMVLGDKALDLLVKAKTVSDVDKGLGAQMLRKALEDLLKELKK